MKSKSNQNDESEPVWSNILVLTSKKEEEEDYDEDDDVQDDSDIDQDEGPDLRSSALIDVSEQEVCLVANAF